MNVNVLFTILDETQRWDIAAMRADIWNISGEPTLLHGTITIETQAVPPMALLAPQKWPMRVFDLEVVNGAGSYLKIMREFPSLFDDWDRALSLYSCDQMIQLI